MYEEESCKYLLCAAMVQQWRWVAHQKRRQATAEAKTAVLRKAGMVL